MEFSEQDEMSQDEKRYIYVTFFDLYDVDKIIDICNDHKFDLKSHDHVNDYYIDKNLFVHLSSSKFKIYYLDENDVPIFIIYQHATPDIENEHGNIIIFDEYCIYEVQLSVYAGLELCEYYNRADIELYKEYQTDYSSIYLTNKEENVGVVKIKVK